MVLFFTPRQRLCRDLLAIVLKDWRFVSQRSVPVIEVDGFEIRLVGRVHGRGVVFQGRLVLGRLVLIDVAGTRV